MLKLALQYADDQWERPPLRIDIKEISSVARWSYDHRLKNSVACSGNSNLFPELAIPK